MGRFHGGVTWRGVLPLLDPGLEGGVLVRAEAPLRASGRRYIPDLVVHCATSGRLLLAIEVWHTHAVGAEKRRAYQDERIPWIEVRAWSVLCWRRSQALPILDWGGIELLESPRQADLFELRPEATATPRKRALDSFNVRGRDWLLPAPAEKLSWLASSDTGSR